MSMHRVNSEDEDEGLVDEHFESTSSKDFIKDRIDVLSTVRLYHIRGEGVLSCQHLIKQ